MGARYFSKAIRLAGSSVPPVQTLWNSSPLPGSAISESIWIPWVKGHMPRRPRKRNRPAINHHLIHFLAQDGEAGRTSVILQ